MSKTVKRAHALLSASSAKQWLACPPSARLSDGLPERVSEYAEEGTLAHDLCELKLHKLFVEPAMPDKTYKAAMSKLCRQELYKPEMDGYTDAYVQHVQEIAYGCKAQPQVLVECQVSFDQWAKEGFGRADCLIFTGDTLHVVDFKYGQGVPVEAKDNPQLSLYALGAYAGYGIFYPIEQVVLHIVQPRAGGISTARTSLKELLDWGESIKPTAQMAWDGNGEYRQGEHCRFCRAAGVCRHCTETNLKAADQYAGKLPPLINDAEVGQALEAMAPVAAWLKKLEAYALNAVLNGKIIPGFKAVEGRSNRVISDCDGLIAALKAKGYEEALLYKREPLTLTGFEQLLPPEDRSTLTPYLTKPQGKPTLVPMSDKRPPYTSNRAAEAFGAPVN